MIKHYFRKETREVTKDFEVGSNLFCDCCDKPIGTHKLSNGYLSPIKYIHITCGHYDWGNDSIDSVESADFCSKECMLEHLNEFLHYNDHRRTAYYEINYQSWDHEIYDPDGLEEEKDE